MREISTARRSGRAAGFRWTWLALAFAGCATVPSPIGRDPLEGSRDAARIAVVVRPEPPKVDLVVFSRSYAEGALKAGAFGAANGAALALQVAPFLVFLGPAGIAAAAVVASSGVVAGAIAGAAVGGAAGAAAVVPEEKAAEIEALVNAAIAGLRLPQLTADSVARNAAKFTPYRVELVDATVATGVGTARDERPLPARGFNAAIEVALSTVGFRAERAGATMALRVAAEARLVDAASGRPVALRGLVYESAFRGVAQWAADGAALTKVELGRATETLGARIVDDFLLRAGPAVGSEAPYPRTPCGLAPLAPTPEWQGSWLTSVRPAASAVDSLTPALAWEAAPDARGFPGAAPWARARDVAYDLRVWEADADDAPGALAYERTGLTGTSHRVEATLRPRSTYFWSVRMRYTANGLPRATRWSASNEPTYVVAPAGIYVSRATADGPVTVACGETDLTPCGCLDFLPAANLYRFATP